MKPTAPRTRSLLRPRVGAILALVDPALAGHAESVHDLRVALRSLRAALDTLTAHPRSSLVKKTRRALGHAIKALADSRDRGVGRELLAKLPASTHDDEASKRKILYLCDRDRRAAIIEAQGRWPKRLDRRLIELLDRDEPALRLVLRRTRAEAWQQRGRALKAIKRLGRRYDPERLHELRRRIRALRYALDVLAEVDSAAHIRLALLKPLQSTLGDAQDRIVLSDWLRESAERVREVDPDFAVTLESEALRSYEQSKRSHAKFLRLRPLQLLRKLALHVDPRYTQKDGR